MSTCPHGYKLESCGPCNAGDIPRIEISEKDLYEVRAHLNWLEDELMEFVRLSSRDLYTHIKPEQEDSITDALRLHGMRLMVEADIEKYEKVVDRWQKRHADKETKS